jgi:hypothetical protein
MVGQYLRERGQRRFRHLRVCAIMNRMPTKNPRRVLEARQKP